MAAGVKVLLAALLLAAVPPLARAESDVVEHPQPDPPRAQPRQPRPDFNGNRPDWNRRRVAAPAYRGYQYRYEPLRRTDPPRPGPDTPFPFLPVR